MTIRGRQSSLRGVREPYSTSRDAPPKLPDARCRNRRECGRSCGGGGGDRVWSEPTVRGARARGRGGGIRPTRGARAAEGAEGSSGQCGERTSRGGESLEP